MSKTITLKSVKTSPQFVDSVDRYLSEFFFKNIYQPLLKEVKDFTIINDQSYLKDAIRKGRVNFYQGKFTGKFSSKVTREIKKLGGKWNRKGFFEIRKNQLPEDLIATIDTSRDAWERKLAKVRKRIESISPEKIADKINLKNLINPELYRINQDIEESYKNLIVSPRFTIKERKQLAEKYNNNMRLYVQNWTKKEIKKLRKHTTEHVLKGSRYEGLAKTIQASYGVSQSKAQFLARQESNLFLAKFKELRYNKAGIDEYIWQTVVGSPESPVREGHKKLNGKKFKFSKPPIVNEKGERKNPSEDFNCRCTARPVVRF